MKLQKASIITAIAGCAILMQGCAAICSSDRQKVRVTSKTPGATIYYKNDSVGVGSAIIKVRKHEEFQTIGIGKKGYQYKTYAFQLGPLSPTASFAVFDALTYLFAPPLIIADLSTDRVHKYKKTHVLPALSVLPSRQPNEKFLLINKTSFDTKADDLLFSSYKKLTQYNRKTAATNGERLPKKNKGTSAKEGIKINNSIFTDELNERLEEMGFVDTTHKLFTNADNTLYLNATVKRMTIHQLFNRRKGCLQMQWPNQLFSIQMEIEWKVLDYYKQPVYTTTTKERSDLFTIESGTKDYTDVVRRIMANSLEHSLSVVHADIGKKGYLAITAPVSDTSSAIEIKQVAAPGDSVRLNEMLRSSVTVKVDDGHGSGVIIADNGYIVTNYHVVAGSKEIEVIFNDDSKAMARVVKVNSSADLALIKVERDSLRALPLSANTDVEVGVDAWAIGTPKSLELGQSLSKGIVSGSRKTDNLSYIQTDVKISPGNSGGALINRRGEVLGIVSSKLIGGGAEGVGFAINAYQVLSKLNIRYK